MKESVIPLSVYEKAMKGNSPTINTANFPEFKFDLNKKTLKIFKEMVKAEVGTRRTRQLFGFLNVFGLWVVAFANLRTRLYFEIHIFRFKWGCYIEGVRIWD